MSKFIDLILEDTLPFKFDGLRMDPHLALEKSALDIFKEVDEKKCLKEKSLQYKLESHITTSLSMTNLLDEKQYNFLKKNISEWQPKIKQQNCLLIKNIFLKLLPDARKKQMLELNCLEYKKYLQAVIEPQIKMTFPQAYLEYCSEQKILSTEDNLCWTIIKPKSMAHFVTTKAKNLVIEDKNLRMAIDKYSSVNEMQNTLYTVKPAAKQLADFSQVFYFRKTVIEQRRDTPTKTFLKAVTTILSAGLAILFGIWTVKGKVVANRMAKVLHTVNAKQSLSSPTLRAS